MWIIFSVTAAVLFSFMFLVFKKLAAFGAPLSLLSVSIGTGLFCVIHIVANRMPFHVPLSAAIWFGIASFLSYVGNYFQLRAINEGPNPGFATAIVGCQSIILMVASFYLFGSDISIAKILGVLLCVAGVVVLSVS